MISASGWKANRSSARIPVAITLATCLWACSGWAQLPSAPDGPPDPDAVRPDTSLIQDLSLPGLGVPGLGGLAGDQQLQLEGRFTLERGSQRGELSLTATLAPQWHVYSLTQRPGGPQPSRIDVVPSPAYRVRGGFAADSDPRVHTVEYFSVPLEEHSAVVTWSAPLELSAGADPQQTAIQLRFSGQVCQDNGSCIPIEDREVVARFAGFTEPTLAATSYRADFSHITWSGRVEPLRVAPGGVLRLVLTATPETQWHVYPYAEAETGGLGAAKPTLIVWQRTAGWPVRGPSVSSQPIEARPLPNMPAQRFHEGPVSWVYELQVPLDALPGEQLLVGMIGYQSCTATGCDMPTGAGFQTRVMVDKESSDETGSLEFSPATYAEVAQAAARAAVTAASGPAGPPLSRWALARAIVFGLLGGVLLNLMPCVLPVIGLKILSFMEQGGQQRSHVFALNVWFAAGLLLVFLVLATLAAFLNMGWGEQFTLTWFKVAMTGLVFAMALSFLGVWEIPIPGFAGSGASHELQLKEGPSGAFFKGVFTTILATPCSGPFLGPVFALTLTQPAYVTYVIFASVGLGMAAPYLLIGLFPGLMRLLPKPGVWMDTFKQLMGFVLLGTVVYLFTTINHEYFIATLTLMVGIWFGCWLVGRTPAYAEWPQKLRAWLGAFACTGAIGAFGFQVLGPQPELLPWQPYSAELLAQLQQEGKTVMVDFTAEWCPTCKWNLKTAINTRGVQRLVEQNEVATLMADWTDRSDTIKRKLAELDSVSIPVLAIYPAGKPQAVIVLRDLLTEGRVLEALRQAGPSQPSPRQTAMR